MILKAYGRKINFFPADTPFGFACKHCGNCCRKEEPELMPIDLIRLANKLGIPTYQFFTKYTKTILTYTSRLPSLRLRTPCPFLKDNTCQIYDCRALSGRMYPVLSYLHNGKRMYALDDSCPGLKTKTKSWNLPKWLKHYELEQLIKEQDAWQAFYHKLIKKKVLIGINEFYETCFFPEFHTFKGNPFELSRQLLQNGINRYLKTTTNMEI